MLAAHQAEGDVLPDRQAVEQRAALKQHAELFQKFVAVAFGGVLAVDHDQPAVGFDKADDALDQHRLAGARSADDHHALALGDRQVDTVKNGLGAEGFMQVLDLDHGFDVGHEEKNTSVSI